MSFLKHKLYIHPLTIPFFILMGVTVYKSRFFTLYIFIFFHELSHCTVSLMLKEKVASLKLLPWGCMLSLATIPDKKHSILILLAGPLFNVIMYFSGIYPEENLALALFNLMPVAPLDGGALVNCIFGKYAFFVSLVFIFGITFFALKHRLPLILPLLLTALLLIGEKNRMEKTVSARIIGYFKGKM